MEPRERPCTSQDVVDGVLVIGFLDNGSGETDNSYDRDVAEFKSRMDALGEAGHPEFAVVDFSNDRTDKWDNGRAVVSLVLSAHRRLKTEGGGLLVCNHPFQFNPDPDLQGMFRLDKVIDMYRSRQEALDSARSRLGI